LCNPIDNENIIISIDHLQAIVTHSVFTQPWEACGFVAGYENKVFVVIPITNISQDPDRFLMNPQEQIRALCMIQSQGMRLIGIYHSHPIGPATPSPVDIAAFQYPGVLVIICSRDQEKWVVQCYKIIDDDFRAEKMRIVDIG